MVWLVGSSVCYNFLPDHLLPKASSSLASIATFCSEELLKGAKLKNPPIDLLKIKIARLSLHGALVERCIGWMLL